MSIPNSPNPYAASTAVPPAKAVDVIAGQSRLEYMRAYNYIFENPNWLTTVLFLALVALAMTIPGVNILVQLLVFGYQFEAIDWLLRTQGRQYPDFDFGRFGDYLSRGIWPFLINLIVTIIFFPLFYIGAIVAVVVVASLASAAGDNIAPVVVIGLGGLAFIGFMLVLIGFSVIITPMILRCGVAQDFGAAFAFDWVLDFARKMWIEIVLAGLFLGLTGFALAAVGLLACIVGIFFVVPLVWLASMHVLYQLYVVYLSRGGTPIPARPALAQPATAPPGQYPYPPPPR